MEGSRSALVNMEARGETATLLNRKCIIIRWSDLGSDKFLDLIHRGAGAMLILLPREMDHVEESIMKVSKSRMPKFLQIMSWW